MALQVWLHVKDLINRGLCSNNASWIGSATYVDGKLGKCYSCTSSHYIDYTYNFASTNKFTIAFWIYIPTSLSTCNKWECVFSLPGYVINWASYNNLKIYDNSNNQLWWLGGDIFYDKWVHLTIAHNADTITLYINGDHYNTANSVSSPISSGTMHVGNGITDAHGPVKFNDIRLYDHCLSPKEVKEISKGLVLHYPLNDAYLQSTTNLNKSIGTSWGHWGTNTITSNSFTSPKGTQGSHVICSSLTNGGVYVDHSSFSVKPSTTYVISAKMKLTGSTHYNLFYWREYDSSNTQLSESGKWSSTRFIEYGHGYKLYYGVVTTSSATNSVRLQSYFYGVGEHWIYDIQVEEGNYPTPFAGYNTSRNETIVHDCSGYQNNGTINGSLSCSSDSPRYKTSTKFNTGNTQCVCPINSNIFTLNLWVNEQDCVGESNNRNQVTWSAMILYRDHNSPAYTWCLNIDSKTRYSTAFYAATPGWRMVTLVSNGLTVTTYLNGNQYWTMVGVLSNCTGTITIGQNINKLINLSDVRLYATALSADDIKELYNTSAYVLDNGTLLTYNLEE